MIITRVDKKTYQIIITILVKILVIEYYHLSDTIMLSLDVDLNCKLQ